MWQLTRLSLNLFRLCHVTQWLCHQHVTSSAVTSVNRFSNPLPVNEVNDSEVIGGAGGVGMMGEGGL